MRKNKVLALAGLCLGLDVVAFITLALLICAASNMWCVIFLGIFGAGIIVGICLITKGLEYLLNQYPKESYLIILGFILGSVVEILPGISNGGTLVVCVLTAVAGFAAIYCLKLKLK